MSDYIKTLLEFATDARQKLTHKIALAVFAVIALLLLNNTFSFTYFYRTNKKIEQIKEINEMMKDTSLSSLAKLELRSIEERTIKRKYWIDQISAIFQRAPNSKPTVIVDTIFLKDGIEVNRTEHSVVRKNFYWHILTSSFPWILAMLIIPIMAITQKNLALGAVVAGVVVSGLFGYFASLLLDLIPVIAGQPWINYTINIVVNILILAILAVSGKRR